MKRRSLRLVVAFAALMVMAVPATAADLHEPHLGSSCGDGYIGTWHFVNSQTEGTTTTGTLTANFTNGGVAIELASKVNRNVQHFYVEGHGTTLLSASTNLPGKLVLSDFWCTEVKK